jgi:hypothetical protein
MMDIVRIMDIVGVVGIVGTGGITEGVLRKYQGSIMGVRGSIEVQKSRFFPLVFTSK